MNSHFEIHFTNIRGFKSNFNSVISHLEVNKPAILALGETQVSCLGAPNDFNCPGYSRIDCLVPHRGLVVFIRDKIHFNIPKFIPPSSNPGFNTLWIEIKISKHSLFICSLYRSPNLSDSDTIHEFDVLSSSIDKIYQFSPAAEVVVMGDFNVHNNTWLRFSNGRNRVGEAAEQFAEFNLLTQLVDKPTRYPDVTGQSPHLLDLFLSTVPDKYSVVVNAPLGLSDHALISARFPIIPEFVEPTRPRLVWHFQNANWILLNEFFISFNWSDCFINNEVDEAAQMITSTILLGMKNFIPSSCKKIKSRRNKWFDGKCQSAVSIKKAAHLRYINCPSDENLVSLRLARNRANATITRAKLEYDRKVRDNMRRVLSSGSNTRSFWSFADLVKRNFAGKASSVPSLFCNNAYYKTSIQKTNLLASHFAAASTLPTSNLIPPILPKVGSSMPKIFFRSRVVSKVLRELNPNKAIGPDGIPAAVLKYCCNSLARPLSKLFHLSMKTGVIPLIWKTANIQPVPKKGDKSAPSNYRPIALLSVLSKVMESIVNFYLTSYLETNKLLSDFQYGFRKNRSSGELMTYMTHCWERCIEHFGECSVVSLDISKAFDRVWHECLISKLHSLNLHASLIEWITNYLSSRKIQVVLDGFTSSSYEVNAGVPQGSSLSPTLFLIYINDLLASTTCDIHSFADDTTLSASIEFINQRESNACLESSREAMNTSILSNIQSILEWGKSNRVEFNPSKFQSCLFSQKVVQRYVAPVINGLPIDRSLSLKMLGLQISTDLSWKEHIYAISKRASQYLGFIRRCNFYFTPSEVLRLYKAYVRPIMEFNSFVWGGAPKSHLEYLDRIQNRVIRMIDDVSITSSLDTLEHRRNVGALSVFYKFYFGRCSSETNSLIPSAFVSRANTRFCSRQHRFALEPFFCRTQHFKSSFFPRVTSMWNQLDDTVFPQHFNPQDFKKQAHRFLKNRELP